MRLGLNSAARALTAVLVLGIGAGSATVARAADTIVMPVQSSAGAKQDLFKMSMRKLWAEHVIWMRGYIVATIAGSSDAKEIEARLLRNPVEIGAAFAPYYGQDAGTKLAAILTEHIRIAGEVVKAAKKPASAKFLDADKRWHENAEQLAVFLSGINPYWSKDMLLKMFNDQLLMTTAEMTARHHKEWVLDVAAFDEIYVQALAMGDELANGVISQFPEKI